MSRLVNCRVVRVPVGARAKITVVNHSDSLEFLQGEVGGYIEAVALMGSATNGVVLWVNEEGNLQPDPKPNIVWPTDGLVLVGSAVITAVRCGALASMTEGQAALWLTWANGNRAAGANVGRG